MRTDSLLLITGGLMLISSFALANTMTLSERDTDVAIAAFRLAQDIFPDIDIETYSKKIDALAYRVRLVAGDTHSPDRRIRSLNTILFAQEKFRADRGISFQRDPRNYYLNTVLDTKQGNCFSLPLLYVAVAQRLGWPIYLVHVPDHSFVRYIDPTFKEQNIETTSGGGYIPDEKYAKDFLVSERGRKSGVYLRALTYKELVGDLMAINGIVLGQQNQMLRSIACLESAIALNPRLVTAWANLATAHTMMAKRSTGFDAERHLKAAEKCRQKLLELGFVHPKDVPQFTSLRRISK